MHITFENDTIVICIPCDAASRAAAQPSKTGKSKLLATTNGFASVEGAPKGLKVSLNVSLPLN